MWSLNTKLYCPILSHRYQEKQLIKAKNKIFELYTYVKLTCSSAEYITRNISPLLWIKRRQQYLERTSPHLMISGSIIHTDYHAVIGILSWLAITFARYHKKRWYQSIYFINMFMIVFTNISFILRIVTSKILDILPPIYQRKIYII